MIYKLRGKTPRERKESLFERKNIEERKMVVENFTTPRILKFDGDYDH